ncbi:hypothetical protein TGAMA5MH_02382 [Trichoderma gamsii]|uniref:ADA HAT complex component 1 n=1 Tax=Trichoderma gamsii TaxID=398673 RepID=A0A2K0TLF2_9HYPO|nr:hypothetical protein TGAMA5MH_02382 [Trichoderma gamsii]
MASSAAVPHNEITKEQFASHLSQYPALLEEISESKGAKDGQRTLSELDHFRYVDAVATFDLKNPKREMDLEDIKTLVEWKLRHGTFRPKLLSLVSSNPPTTVSQTLDFARNFYTNSNDARGTVRALAKLKGIGPATASLLLSVHDAQNAIFFSDEAFYWLCCGGKKASIKYNIDEYAALNDEAQALVKRLDVSATDIEKVAYVLMKRSNLVNDSKADTAKANAPAKAKNPAASEPKKRKTASNESVKTETKAKGKVEEKALTEENSSVRRSKRLRK